MPPSSAHFNGSVNLADPETVMRELAARVPVGLRRLPDGETGDRGQWIFFQLQKFLHSRAFVPVRNGGSQGDYQQIPKVRLANGVTAATLHWPDLGYAAAYAESYQTVARLSTAGVIPAAARFQVQYPTPLAPVSAWISADQQDDLLSSYGRALPPFGRPCLRQVSPIGGIATLQPPGDDQTTAQERNWGRHNARPKQTARSHALRATGSSLQRPHRPVRLRSHRNQSERNFAMTPAEQTPAIPTDYEATIRVHAPADAVFDAITTVGGLAAWWNPAAGSGETGGELRFMMNAPDPLVIHVDEATRPTSVRWTVTDCPFLPDWIGTRPVFTITPVDGDSSELHFRHGGLTEELECHDMCTHSWNHYMTSLRDLLEAGHGSPFGSPADTARRQAQADGGS